MYACSISYGVVDIKDKTIQHDPNSLSVSIVDLPKVTCPLCKQQNAALRLTYAYV